jgi:outer membrane lipoprotein carrier protein
MESGRHKRSAALFATIFITLLATVAWSQPVVERLIQAHEGVTDVRARFVQTTTLEAVELDRVSGGTVNFKRGGKMRWSYEGEDPQLLVSDGTLLWIYQERDRTALRREVATLTPSGRLALDILDGAVELEEHFVIDSCGDNCAELIARVPGGDVDRLTLEVAADTGLISRITTFDQVGNVTKIDFSGVKTNTGAEDKLFTFTPPEGVDLFDAEGNPL